MQPTQKGNVETTKPLNIYQRINAVRNDNDYIKKEKTVDGKYKVVTHDQVTAEVRKDLIKHGVVIEPQLVSGATVQATEMKTSKGVPIIRYEGVFDVRFINVDEPKDMALVRVPAHALDTGDKAPGKAVSYAVKMAMLKMFSIETGEEDEDRREKDAAGDKLDEAAFKAWEVKIDAVGGKTVAEIDANAQSLWEKIHEAVNVEAADVVSGTKLRARLTTHVSRMKKGLKNAAK